MVLIPASSLQLIWTSCRRSYIMIWHPPTSCECHNFAFNSTPRQSRSPLISWYLWLDAPVIYTGAFLLLTAWPGRRSICNSISRLLFQCDKDLYHICAILLFPLLSGSICHIVSQLAKSIISCDKERFYAHECLTCYIYIIIYIYPTPPLGQDMTQGQFLRLEFRVFLLLD